MHTSYIITNSDKAECVTSIRSWSFFFAVNNKRINDRISRFSRIQSRTAWEEQPPQVLWGDGKKRGYHTWAPSSRRAGPGRRAEQMAGRSRGKVCKGRKELREWEHTGKGSGSRCIRVPRFPNGFLQQMISSGLSTLVSADGSYCILIPPPQKGEERIQNSSLSIKHTENNKQIFTAAYS